MVGLPWSNDAEHCVIVNDAQTFGAQKMGSASQFSRMSNMQQAELFF